MSGYHLDSAMIAGAAPIDWLQPLIPHRTAKTTNRVVVARAPPPENSPSSPTQRLAMNETVSPVAMKRLMLLWSASSPFTNFPAA